MIASSMIATIAVLILVSVCFKVHVAIGDSSSETETNATRIYELTITTYDRDHCDADDIDVFFASGCTKDYIEQTCKSYESKTDTFSFDSARPGNTVTVQWEDEDIGDITHINLNSRSDGFCIEKFQVLIDPDNYQYSDCNFDAFGYLIIDQELKSQNELQAHFLEAHIGSGSTWCQMQTIYPNTTLSPTSSTVSPTSFPSVSPTVLPTFDPSSAPTSPTLEPTQKPTHNETVKLAHTIYNIFCDKMCGN